MTVVSNASPLIALSRIEKLDLLPALFGQVLVPEAVWLEVVVNGAGRAGSQECVQAEKDGWLSRRQVEDIWTVGLLEAHLGPGESEAIVLAREVEAEWLLVDDDLARAYALRLGLPVKGTVGILVAAFHAGLLSDLQHVLDELMVNGFRIGPRLYKQALAAAHEDRT